MSGTEEEDLMADAWAAALEEQVTAEAKPAPLEELKDDAPISAEERRKLDTILDIPVTISMEVGRSQISIRNLLQLNQGSVVELDRVAGEPPGCTGQRHPDRSRRGGGGKRQVRYSPDRCHQPD